MTNKSKVSVLLAAVAMTSAVFAQQAQTPSAAVTATPADAPVAAAAEAGSPLTLDASVKYVTAYFSRGYNYGDTGLILQPEATVAYAYKASDKLTITPWFNVWNNVTDKHYADGDYWDEIDLTPGVDLTCERVTLSLQYIYYNSPMNNWGDIQELGAVLSYDDSDQLGLPIALNPYVAYYQEISNDDHSNRSYAEAGIKPKWVPSKDIPLTFTFPITLGMNANGWYANEKGDQTTFGYTSAAVMATYNITKHLYTTAGVKYIYLMADNIVDLNEETHNQFIGSVAIGYAF